MKSGYCPYFRAIPLDRDRLPTGRSTGIHEPLHGKAWRGRPFWRSIGPLGRARGLRATVSQNVQSWSGLSGSIRIDRCHQKRLIHEPYRRHPNHAPRGAHLRRAPVRRRPAREAGAARSTGEHARVRGAGAARAAARHRVAHRGRGPIGVRSDHAAAADARPDARPRPHHHAVRRHAVRADRRRADGRSEAVPSRRRDGDRGRCGAREGARDRQLPLVGRVGGVDRPRGHADLVSGVRGRSRGEGADGRGHRRRLPGDLRHRRRDAAGEWVGSRGSGRTD